MSLFARRFAPLDCVTLDEGSGMAYDGRRWSPAAGGARRITRGGRVEDVAALPAREDSEE